MKATYYCSCGSWASGSSTPANVAVEVIDAFRKMHAGDGHHEVTQQEAASVRRKLSRKVGA